MERNGNLKFKKKNLNLHLSQKRLEIEQKVSISEISLISEMIRELTKLSKFLNFQKSQNF